MITHMSWTHDGDDKENGKKVACLEVAGERENGRARGRHARGEGAGNDFRGPSVQALPLPSRVSFSRARFFLCPLLPSRLAKRQ